MICFFGHHRSGSTYVKTILTHLARIQGAGITTVHTTERLRGDTKSEWLILSNTKAEALNQITFKRGFHVIRDPRDVVVSSYFSHLHSHKTIEWPELIEHREYLRSVDFEVGLLHEILECRKEQLEDLGSWKYEYPDILEIKFEELTADPVKYWKQIFAHLQLDIAPTSILNTILTNYNLGVGAITRKSKINQLASLLVRNKLTQAELDKTVLKFNYEKFSKRTKGKEDIHHHYRKGIAGDWKNHFSLKHKEVFKEKWGDLLIQLNYEHNNDW